MKQVSITFTIEDVEHLYHTSTQSFYREQHERFEILKDPHNLINKNNKYYMYFIEGDANALLFTKILSALGYKVAELWDLATPEFCMISDWSSNWDEIANTEVKFLIKKVVKASGSKPKAAAILGVANAQVSKWFKGDYMSNDIRQQCIEFIKVNNGFGEVTS